MGLDDGCEVLSLPGVDGGVLETGRVESPWVRLNQSALEICRILRQPTSIDELRRTLSDRRPSATERDVRSAMSSVIDFLEARELIRLRSEPAAPSTALAVRLGCRVALPSGDSMATRVVRAANGSESHPALLFRPGSREAVEDPSRRDTDDVRLPDALAAELQQDVEQELVQASTELSVGFDAVTRVQVLRYRQGQFYGWHRDRPSDDRVDKLSSRLLSYVQMMSGRNDFTDGDLELQAEIEQGVVVRWRVPLDAGSSIVFPPHLLHRVRAVTSGVRVTAVAWAKAESGELTAPVS